MAEGVATIEDSPDSSGTRAVPQLVLVVDDDAAALKLTSRWLENAGIQVLTARGPEEAERLANQNSGLLGAILLDIMMPRVDGFELLRQFKADAALADVPVVLLTAHANDEQDVIRGIEAGADEHLQKPFLGRVLVAKVRALCRKRSEARALHHRLQMAEAMAMTDPLTQLGNRRRFEEQLHAERAYTTRHKHPFTMLTVDVDHFKAINDRFGHPEGDRVLTFIADQLRETLRLSDQVFRLGGEEFGVLLRGSDSHSGLLAAERVIAAVSERPFVFSRGESRTVTVSVGVAAADANADFKSDDIVERSDKALYKAKALGRNRAFLCES